jgi:tRNA (guanine-N7-)-methyltransferase
MTGPRSGAGGSGRVPADQRFYGRRKGRPLGKTLQRLLADTLPLFRLDPGAPLAGQFAHAPGDVFLEIGFGGGEHLAGLALARPDAGFIGAEPFINGVATMLRHINEQDLKNVRLWDDDVRQVLPKLPAGCLTGAYVMFPDPWPKRRHAARRILNPAMMETLARLIRPRGMLMLASDDPTAKGWLLQAATAHPGFSWTARRPADWRNRPADIPETRYMRKAHSAARTPSWFRFERIT